MHITFDIRVLWRRKGLRMWAWRMYPRCRGTPVRGLPHYGTEEPWHLHIEAGRLSVCVVVDRLDKKTIGEVGGLNG